MNLTSTCVTLTMTKRDDALARLLTMMMTCIPPRAVDLDWTRIWIPSTTDALRTVRPKNRRYMTLTSILPMTLPSSRPQPRSPWTDRPSMEDPVTANMLTWRGSHSGKNRRGHRRRACIGIPEELLFSVIRRNVMGTRLRHPKPYERNHTRRRIPTSNFTRIHHHKSLPHRCPRRRLSQSVWKLLRQGESNDSSPPRV